MIFTDRTIIVQKGTSSINDTVVLYRGDKNIEIRFTLNEGSPFKFGSGASPNIIEKTEAAYGQLIIKTPNDLPSIFSEIVPTNEGKIIFTITTEMIDEITEVGNYTFQIRLLDENKESRVTIPEVVNGIEIREPIATEDVSTSNEIGVATVGYAITTAGTSEDAFDTQGNYNKTTWGTGDRITAAKLNKIEAGIDGVNQKVASGSTGGEAGVDLSIYQTKTDNTLNTTNKTVSGAINEINEAMVITEEQTGDITVGEVPVGGSNKASDITITDTAGNYTSNNVEGALQEVGSQIKEKADKTVANDIQQDVASLSNKILSLENNITHIPCENVYRDIDRNKSFIYSTNRSGISNIYYCNESTFNNDILINKLEIPVIVTSTGDKTLLYMVLDANMIVISAGQLTTPVDTTGTHNVTFSNLAIDLPKGGHIAFTYKDDTCKPTYDVTHKNENIHSVANMTHNMYNTSTVNIGETMNWRQTLNGSINYILYYKETASIAETLNNIITKDELDAKVQESVAQSSQNRLYGKKIIAIGDSMVQGHSIAKDEGWLAMIANRNNMTFVNYGINGTYMTNKLYGKNKGVVERYMDMDNDADYIIVFAGTNDGNSDVVIGENSSSNPSEFKGALNIICKGLLDKYPTKRIMFITPYLRNSKYVDYINAIEDICALYGIRVFNNMKNGGICWQNTAQVQALTLNDTYHLNLAGMEYASYKYEEELKRL